MRPRRTPSALENHYFYGHYYAAQAMWQAGGDYWRRWYPKIRDALLERRKPDGSWFDQSVPRIRHRHGLSDPPNA